MAGKAVAIVLMITGIGLFGFAAAALASWLTEKVGGRGEELDELEEDTDQLLVKVRELRREVAALRSGLGIVLGTGPPMHAPQEPD